MTTTASEQPTEITALQARKFDQMLFTAIRLFHIDDGRYERHMEEISLLCSDEQWGIVCNTMDMIRDPNFIKGELPADYDMVVSHHTAPAASDAPAPITGDKYPEATKFGKDLAAKHIGMIDNAVKEWAQTNVPYDWNDLLADISKSLGREYDPETPVYEYVEAIADLRQRLQAAEERATQAHAAWDQSETQWVHMANALGMPYDMDTHADMVAKAKAAEEQERGLRIELEDARIENEILRSQMTTYEEAKADEIIALARHRRRWQQAAGNLGVGDEDVQVRSLDE